MKENATKAKQCPNSFSTPLWLWIYNVREDVGDAVLKVAALHPRNKIFVLRPLTHIFEYDFTAFKKLWVIPSTSDVLPLIANPLL